MSVGNGSHVAPDPRPGHEDDCVTVEYAIDSYGSEPSGQRGPPENYDPGSGPEIFLTAILDEESRDISSELQLEQRAALEHRAWENFSADNPAEPDGECPDAARDRQLDDRMIHGDD